MPLHVLALYFLDPFIIWTVESRTSLNREQFQALAIGSPSSSVNLRRRDSACSRSLEAIDARAVLFYCVGALRTSRAQSERQVNGVRKAQWDFNQGEVIEGACSIDCSSLHLDKPHRQRAEKQKSEESVLTASGQLL